MGQSQTDILKLRRDLLTMAANVEARVAEAFKSFLNHDLELARTVRAGDDEIDQQETDIETECLRILALDAPVASDLRFTLATLRINSALERIADMARAVAKKTIKLDAMPSVECPSGMHEMCEIVQGMVSDVCRALANDDAELANEVRKRDDQVDQRNKEFFAWVVGTISQDVANVEPAIHLLIASRTIERMGDVAVNIAEDIIFAIGGNIVRHTRV